MLLPPSVQTKPKATRILILLMRCKIAHDNNCLVLEKISHFKEMVDFLQLCRQPTPKKKII